MTGRRGRPGRVAIGATAAVVLVGAGGVAALGFGGGDPARPPVTALPPATAKVTRTTLTSKEKVTGTLGYGTPTTVTPKAGQGTLTWLPAPGAVIARGQTVYAVDDKAVPAIHGAVPPYRQLKSGVSGKDVRQLEENLRALGYQGFTVDDDYTSATAQAVRDWQEDLGRPQTGTVDAGDVVVVPGDVRVADVQAQPGAPASGPVLTCTSTTRTVTVALDVGKQHLVGQDAPATVTLPDGKAVPGSVTSIGSVATAQPAQQQGGSPTSTIEVVVTLADPAAAGRLDSAPVEVTLVSGKRDDVLAVPVGALVALAEGGYGVEVVDGASTRYVPVTTGMFADGKVEVSGQGIDAGTVVGVPR